MDAHENFGFSAAKELKEQLKNATPIIGLFAEGNTCHFVLWPDFDPTLMDDRVIDELCAGLRVAIEKRRIEGLKELDKTGQKQ